MGEGNYSYSVREEDDGWRWEVRRDEIVLASGIEPTSVLARAQAIRAAIKIVNRGYAN
jgi:hypothetical protein